MALSITTMPRIGRADARSQRPGHQAAHHGAQDAAGGEDGESRLACRVSTTAPAVPHNAMPCTRNASAMIRNNRYTQPAPNQQKAPSQDGRGQNERGA
jgi:hypothetical protein